jgi:hypothetical protein
MIMSKHQQTQHQGVFDSIQARLASLRELQSQTGEELSALLPSVLRPSGWAFKGEL